MIGRKSAIGISVACALLVSVFAASDASGAAWVTCQPGGFQFGDAHCVNAGTGFQHIPIPTGQITLATFTNVSTAVATTAASPWKLRGTVGGMEIGAECTEVSGSGSIENTTESVANASVRFEYAGCTVTKPAGKGCVISGGKFSSEGISVTTEGLEAGTLEISPESGTVLAEVKIESCSAKGLNNTYPISGRIRVAPAGATWGTTHEEVTAANTLRFAGSNAGIESAVTMRMREGNPISLT
jgi:hypothetical protein